MATANELATRAAKRAGFLDPYESLTAEEGTDVVQALNDMLAEWVEQDCDLSLTLPLSGSDTITDGLQISAIVANLAVRIAPDFGLSASPELYAQANTSKSTLQDSLETMAGATFDDALLDASKRRASEII